MNHRLVVGMEVHLQLRTQSKMFCRCAVRFGAPPNTLVCPVCLGLPGTLPVPNRNAMILALALAQALGCELAETTRFDRKNYFYPDLPKGYQISQFAHPLGTGGSLEFITRRGPKRVRIRRLHLEEDVGKSLHGDTASRIDFNRAGTPLVEIVSEPEIFSPEEARAYLNALRAVIRYLDISDANMQAGNLRCEPNVNLHIEAGERVVRTPIVEIKNLNSVRNVERAIRCEVERQLAEFAERGAEVADGPRRTCGYDQANNRTFVMRSKEEEHDYRYFPEPDIPPIGIGKAWREEAAALVPELPAARRGRFAKEYGLTAYDADNLCRERSTADYFEQVVAAGAPAKPAANWVLGEMARHANARDCEPAALGLLPGRLAALIGLVEHGRVARQAAVKEVLPRLLAGESGAEGIVEKLGLSRVDDAALLREAARRAVQDDPASAEDFRKGKDKALGALMGRVMRDTKGKANPAVIQNVLREILEES